MKCMIFEKGKLEKSKVKEYMFGVYLGKFKAEVCNKCGESFTDSITTKKIEDAAKNKGLWGLSAITKITKTGNSLAIRIPKKVAEYLKFKNGKEAYLYPDEKKLIIEARN